MIFRSDLVLSLISILLIQFSVNLYAADKHRYQVLLQNNAQTVSIPVASIEFKPVKEGYDFIVKMNEDQFGDYFLSMRPFKCMTDKINMLCHLAYPYEINRHITDQDLTALEYDFLFIRRKPSDYGINPWNGLYYQLHKQGEDYIGQAHEVDLDILATPPADDDPFPIKQVDLHEIDAQHLWLPRLLIKAE